MLKFAITYNGQSLSVIAANGDKAPYDAEVISDYVKNGKSIGRIGYGGYDDGAIIFAQTRTLANMIHRHMRNNGIELAKMQGDN